MSMIKNTAFLIYKRLLKAVYPYWKSAVLSIIGILCYAGVDGILYTYLQPLIDNGFVKREIRFLYWVPIFITGIFLIRGLASFLTTFCMGKIGRSVVRDYRCAMLCTLMRLPVRFFDERTTGELISKINYNTEQVAEAITDAVAGTIRGACQALALVLVMVIQNWKITLFVMFAAPILGIFIQSVSRKMREHSSLIQITMGTVTQLAEEIISGHKVIRTFGGHAYEEKRISTITETNRVQEMKMIITTAASVPMMQFIGAIALSLLVLLATLGPESLFGPAMTAGQFAAMFAAMLGLLRPIKQISIMNSKLQRGIAGAESIFALLDEEKEKDTGILRLGRSHGTIGFHNVSFAYPEVGSSVDSANGTLILNDVSFSLKAGEKVALVGRSGSGKTTLASLLPRFYEVSKGNITLDGIPIQEIALSNLREQFSIVSQKVILFNDTVANNIAYGIKDTVTREAILEAARFSEALSFIEKLPLGFETMIGEQGVRLSGGQCQRISIARALLKDAPILILDEATSFLDPESEKLIQKALEILMKGRTTLIITHRLSTIEKADKILVLEDGCIVEMGTHLELMAKNSYYSKLYKAQFIESIQEFSYS